MTPEEKRKAIEYIVHEVYIREHNRLLQEFLVKYGDAVRQSLRFADAIGINVSMPPLTFDLRKPTEELVNNLIVSFEVLHKGEK